MTKMLFGICLLSLLGAVCSPQAARPADITALGYAPPLLDCLPPPSALDGSDAERNTDIHQETPDLDEMPDGFVHVTDLAPDALLDIRYYSAFNFAGTRIDGYQAPNAILSRPAAEALVRVAAAACERGYVLRIFDAYRPQAAVDHFVRWAEDPLDQTLKNIFYPEVDKNRLFELNYIAQKSGHSRGATVDLTLVDRISGQELDMGSPFDFFGPISHHGTPLITPAQSANRAILQTLMQENGFKPYAEEWWHYTLEDEPYPDTYFNFPVR